MFNPLSIFDVAPNLITKDQIARLLQTSPEALDEFEKAYAARTALLKSDNFFDVNAKQAASNLPKTKGGHCPEELVDRIVDELLAQTAAYVYKDGCASRILFSVPEVPPVTHKEIMAVPEEDRPWLAGNFYKPDLPGSSCDVLLYHYREYLNAESEVKRCLHYNQFRQGLDILDLDPLTYEIIGTNRNSIGHWLPQLIEGIQKQNFFSVPNTTFIKVPLPLLPLTRLPYEALPPSTIRILDQYCMKAFDLDVNKNYFIKTGTCSSKFDFRNACVRGEKEVRELGEYLLFIHYQACAMASPLSTPSVYGVSATNEWVVREFIEDKQKLPTIYRGMPLRTEYRVFADFDAGTVLGMNPYWDPDVMKQRFGHGSDANDPHQIHDYTTYRAREQSLMAEYEANKDQVKEHIQKMLPDIPLDGQWSIDVMQDGNNFYIIDMALAANSALNSCVPKHLLKTPKENWLPQIPIQKTVNSEKEGT